MTTALRARARLPEHPAKTAADGAASDALSRPWAGTALAAWAGVFCVVILPAAYAASWTPRVALLLPMVVPGLVVLVLRARLGVPGARLGVAFLVAAAASTALADRPLLSLIGNHNRGSGWLFLAALLGLWALGVGLDARGRRMVGAALIAGVLVSAAVGWLQAAFDLPVEQLDAGGPRSQGLTGNAAIFGALMAGGFWLAADQLARDHRWKRWAIAVLALAGAVQLSGSRAALGALAAFGLFWVVRLVRRNARSKALGLALAVGLGVVLSIQLAAAGAASSRARTSLDPTAGSGRGATWVAGLEAVTDRPLLGSGPARSRPAVLPLLGPELARTEPPDTEPDDAHNFLLEYTVTTGVVGGALFVGWLVVTARRARGAAAGFALGIGVVGLFQPVSIATAPLAVLALGCAAAPRSSPGPAGGAGVGPDGTKGWGPVARRVAVVGAVLGVGASALFTTGEVALNRAYTEFSATTLTTADRVLPPWSAISSVEWRIHAFEAISRGDADAWGRAVDAAERAVERDPSSAHLWANLGDLLLRTGQVEDAEVAYGEALERHRWSLRALNANIYFSAQRGDVRAVDTLCRQRNELDVPESCPGSVIAIYEQ